MGNGALNPRLAELGATNLPKENRMRNRYFTSQIFMTLCVLAFGAGSVNSREPDPPATVPVHTMVTVEARHGREVPVIKAEDVQVYQGRERVQVTDWLPLQGERAGLELFVLLDDASSTGIGSQLEDLREFMLSQPPTTAVGVGYMRDGTVDIAQNLTNDHVLAASKLRLPLGSLGAFASVYLSISDLIKRWPESPLRREVVVVSDGIDHFGGTGPANPYVDSAIEQAQRAGIIIYAIYARAVGHYGHSFWRMNWGQNYLSQVADQTGGEAYFLGNETPISFAPYLDDITRRLNHQYLLAFLAKPGKKGELQHFKVRTEVSNVELVAPDRVYVPAGT
jgi:hypothetical protein